MKNLPLLFISFFLINGYCSLTFAAQYNVYNVSCNATTPVCECPETTHNGNVKIDVCVFQLDIIRLYSFTSYRIDPSGRVSTRGGGKVWYINETTSELSPYPAIHKYGQSDDCSNPSLLSNRCTKPLTVDGKTFRSLYTVNGQSPGPTLIVSFNQTLVINVTNSLDSETVGIHWHGLYHVKTNCMDGVESITQCGISPGNTFTYIFQANPSGSFWYHSHTGTTRADGMYGALIIRDTADSVNRITKEVGSFNDLPYEHTVLLNDFYKEKYLKYRLHTHSGVYLYNTHRSPDPSYTPQPVFTSTADGGFVGGIPFWSGLINGQGRHPRLDYAHTRLTVFTVLPSMRYRLRIIGSVTRYGLRFSVDEHQLVVVATDGSLVKPVTVDYLFIHAGERYDVIVQTKSGSELMKNNFVMRAETLEYFSSNNDTNFFKGHSAEAILYYNTTKNTADYPKPQEYWTIINNSIPVAKRCTPTKPCKALNCFFKSFPSSYNMSCIGIHELELMIPITEDNLLPSVQPDQYMISNWGFEGSVHTSSINARKLKLPPSPFTSDHHSRIDYCKGLDNSSYCNSNAFAVSTPECICTHVQNISSTTDSLQFVFAGVITNLSQFAYSAHPIHFHGHKFHVVDIQYGGYTPNGRLSASNKDITCGPGNIVCSLPSWSKGNDYAIGKSGKVSNKAVLKDTIVVPAGGYVVAYLVPNNPGYWFLHCHMSDHLLEGMGYIVRYEDDHGLTPAVPSGMPSCGDFSWSVTEYYNQLLLGTSSTGTTTTGTTTTGTVDGTNFKTDIICSDTVYWIYGGLFLYIIVLVCVQVILLVVCCVKFC